MHYKNIYFSLINKRKKSIPEGYTEKHHIIPKCLGGSDDVDNVVILTPEEHYVAHQLLVKIYPDNHKLTWAAIMMTGHHTENRSKNKIYGWIKRKYQKECKERTGEKNGSYGKFWFYNPKTLETIKISKKDAPNGWERGRKPKRCKTCGEIYPYCRVGKYCSELCKKQNYISVLENDYNSFYYANVVFDDIRNSNCKTLKELYKKLKDYPYSYRSFVKTLKNKVKDYNEYIKYDSK